MKSCRSYAVPALFAVGLWLTGNSLLGTSPVRGQGGIMEVPGASLCMSDPIPPYIANSHCQFSPFNLSCSGYCDGYILYTKSCQNDSQSNSTATCTNGSGPIQKQYIAGGCYYNPFVQPGIGRGMCTCSQGSPVGGTQSTTGPSCGYSI